MAKSSTMTKKEKAAPKYETLEKLRAEIYRCCRCGLCKIPLVADERTSACPSRQLYGFESMYSRGRAQVARALIDGEYEMKDDFVQESLYKCTTCGFCDTYCPLEVHNLEIAQALREEATKAGLAPLPRHQDLIKSLESYDNPWMQPRATKGRWAKGLDIKDALKDKVDVLYYVGCTSSFDPNIGNPMALACAKLLEKGGINFGILGKEEVCCGATLFKIGQKELGTDFAKRNIEAMQKAGVKKVVVTCAGCYGTFNFQYPEILGELPFEVQHVSEVFVDLLKAGKLKPKKVTGTYTYHDPCHLARHKFIASRNPELAFETPRKIINSIPGIQFKEMVFTKHNSFCCGAGGGVKTNSPEQALEISKMRIGMAEEAGADNLVTACPFCKQNLADGAAARKSKVKVMDLSELLLEAVS